jgi:hypothetical protein
MKPRCAGCKKRISRGEPDLILRKMAPENSAVVALRLTYHERCKDAALERVQATPALWRMTHRYIEAKAN